MKQDWDNLNSDFNQSQGKLWGPGGPCRAVLEAVGLALGPAWTSQGWRWAASRPGVEPQARQLPTAECVVSRERLSCERQAPALLGTGETGPARGWGGAHSIGDTWPSPGGSRGAQGTSEAKRQEGWRMKDSFLS